MAQLENIGTSVEGRNITAVHVCSRADCSELPAVVFNGCQHARYSTPRIESTGRADEASREWLSPMTVTYVLSGLLANYTTSSEVKDVVDGFDWWFIPVVNTDGYAFSWDSERLWRKNRRANPDSSCIGVRYLPMKLVVAVVLLLTIS